MKVQLKSGAPNKNASGQLGPICNNCGGYGYTLSIGGTSSSGCYQCDQTGVAMSTTGDLEQKVANLELEIKGLKNIILDEIRRTK